MAYTLRPSQTRVLTQVLGLRFWDIWPHLRRRRTWPVAQTLCHWPSSAPLKSRSEARAVTCVGYRGVSDRGWRGGERAILDLETDREEQDQDHQDGDVHHPDP
jgi:hypothetical protein